MNRPYSFTYASRSARERTIRRICNWGTPKRARWVNGESWYAMQEIKTEADGSYVLSFPYSADRELIGDIMRYEADVQVLAPPALRSKVQKGFLEAAAKYV